MAHLIDFVRHLDDHVSYLAANYGPWAYGIFFLIIFSETGLVFAPFLPGDTLLFAVGLFARPEKHAFNLPVAFGLLMLAALCGDQVNYHVGKYFGMKLFTDRNRGLFKKLFKRSNLDKTHEYFERRGPSTVIFARFIPIVRTTAPFVAGMGTMQHGLFTKFSMVAAFLWVGICMGFGYFFGAIPAVQKNFGLAAGGMLLLSIIPLSIEIIGHYLRQKKAAKA